MAAPRLTVKPIGPRDDALQTPFTLAQPEADINLDVRGVAGGNFRDQRADE